MAKCEVKYNAVNYELILTKSEAELIKNMFGSIMDGTGIGRCMADEIFDVLDAAGVKDTDEYNIEEWIVFKE